MCVVCIVCAASYQAYIALSAQNYCTTYHWHDWHTQPLDQPRLQWRHYEVDIIRQFKIGQNTFSTLISKFLSPVRHRSVCMQQLIVLPRDEFVELLQVQIYQSQSKLVIICWLRKDSRLGQHVVVKHRICLRTASSVTKSELSIKSLKRPYKIKRWVNLYEC